MTGPGTSSKSAPQCGPGPVFISYSHDSDAHRRRVAALAQRLRKEGVDARIDAFVVAPEGGWHFWMEQEIARARFVLLVCSEAFLRKVEAPESSAGGQGVFWEANMVRTFLYESKGTDTRFIPIFFGDQGHRWIPHVLRSATRYQVDSPQGYEDLYRLLTNQPAIRAVELGGILVLPPLGIEPFETAPAPASAASLAQEAEFIKLDPLPCDERDLRSQVGDNPTMIRFDNYLPEPVALYWINYEGHRVYYATVQPGGTFLMNTYVTHPWVIAKTDIYALGHCLAIFQPAAQPGIAAIAESRSDPHS